MQVEGSLLCIYVTTSANLILYNQVLIVIFLLRRIREKTVLSDFFFFCSLTLLIYERFGFVDLYLMFSLK